MGLDMYIFDQENDELVYWRKANQINGWFNRVFDGVENTTQYPLTKEILIELVEDCKTVLSLLETKAKKIYIKEYDEEEIDLEKAYYIYEEVPDEVYEILPPTQGFFFGSDEIDSYYEYQIRHTIEMVQPLINVIDENYQMYYYIWY